MTRADLDLIADRVCEKILQRQSEILPVVPKEPDRGRKIDGIREVAKFLGISPAKVQAMKNAGQLPFYMLGAHHAFAFENELIEALRR